MIEILSTFAITLISLVVGYFLGKYSAPTPPTIQKKIDTIFKRVVNAGPTLPNTEVGVIQRPSATQNYYRDNPKVAEEHMVMADAFAKQQEGN